MGNAQSYVVNGFFWVLAENSDIAKAIRYDVPESKIGIARGMHKTGVLLGANFRGGGDNPIGMTKVSENVASMLGE